MTRLIGTNNIIIPENLLPTQGELYYYPNVFTLQESEDLYTALNQNIKWKQEPITLFGKMVMQPRLTSWYANEGVSYSYSGITMNGLKWNEELLFIKEHIERITQCKYNSALLNLYRDGNDSMGWHRDNEKELGNSPAIASVTLGAIRKFQLRRYKEKHNLLNLYPENGSCLLMKGSTQQHWEHCLPKSKQIIKPRLNITFRMVY